MKNLLAILLTLLMILSLAACGAAPEAPVAEPEAPAEEEFEEPAADPNVRIAATEYTYDCTEESVVIENLIFSEPLTLNVQAGSTVQLLNCVFEQDVTYNGTSGSIVVFDEGCELAEDVVVHLVDPEKEATMDTTLPRIVTLHSLAVDVAGRGNVVAAGAELELVINGQNYTVKDCQYTFDPETGEQVEADPSAEYNIFAVANWYENGEHVVFSFAEF